MKNLILYDNLPGPTLNICQIGNGKEMGLMDSTFQSLFSGTTLVRTGMSKYVVPRTAVLDSWKVN
jgi:hypothetical protein